MCVSLLLVCPSCAKARRGVRTSKNFITFNSPLKGRDKCHKNCLTLSMRLSAYKKVQMYLDCIVCMNIFSIKDVSLPMTWYRLPNSNREIVVNTTMGTATTPTSFCACCFVLFVVFVCVVFCVVFGLF